MNIDLNHCDVEQHGLRCLRPTISPLLSCNQLALIGLQLRITSSTKNGRTYSAVGIRISVNNISMKAAACSPGISRSRRHGAQFRTNLLPEEFSQLFAQPVDRETLSGSEEELHDRVGGDLPPPYLPLVGPLIRSTRPLGLLLVFYLKTVVETCTS
jgi:hypothetical protein